MYIYLFIKDDDTHTNYNYCCKKDCLNAPEEQHLASQNGSVIVMIIIRAGND